MCVFLIDTIIEHRREFDAECGLY